VLDLDYCYLPFVALFLSFQIPSKPAIVNTLRYHEYETNNSRNYASLVAGDGGEPDMLADAANMSFASLWLDRTLRKSALFLFVIFSRPGDCGSSHEVESELE
jgi:hypothetical protein